MMFNKEKERKRIGQRIADLRKEKGLTQLDIANKKDKMKLEEWLKGLK